MTIICHTIHFIETCLPNDFGPIFFCWGCKHGKPLYRGILCRSKGYKVYKVASPGKNDFFQGFYLDWPLYRDEDLPWKGSSGWWGSWVRRARARARAPKGSQNWSLFGACARARGALRTPFFPRTPFKGKFNYGGNLCEMLCSFANRFILESLVIDYSHIRSLDILWCHWNIFTHHVFLLGSSVGGACPTALRPTASTRSWRSRMAMEPNLVKLLDP